MVRNRLTAVNTRGDLAGLEGCMAENAAQVAGVA